MKMAVPAEITCTDRDGNEHKFSFRRIPPDENKAGPKKWLFRVGNFDPLADEFNFDVVEIDNGSLKVVSMHAVDNMYRGKGIPEQMIIQVAAIMGRSISSSSNKHKYKDSDNECRTPDATKVWNRLVSKGLAEFDQEKDIYTYHPGKQ